MPCEALSYNLDVVASDIPANTEVPLPRDCFAKKGDVEDLAETIATHLASDKPNDYSSIIHEYYDWDKIAEQTAVVYRELVSAPKNNVKKHAASASLHDLQ